MTDEDFVRFSWRCGAIALALLGLAITLLPVHVRRKVLQSLAWLTAFAITAAFSQSDFIDPATRTPLHFAAIFFLLCSCARSLMLLLFQSRPTRSFFGLVPQIMQDVAQVLIYLCLLLFVLHWGGIEPGSLVESSALITAGIGFLMKDTLGNIFSGLALHAEQPFGPGDWIQYDSEKSHIGQVVQMNWRASRLLTLDRAEITVPNSVLAQTAIVNFSKPNPASRRSVYVDASDKMPPQNVHRTILTAIDGTPGVLKEPAPSVVTNGFSERGIEYWIRFFITDLQNRDRIDGEVRDRIWHAFQRERIVMPGIKHQVDTVQHTRLHDRQKRRRRLNQRQRALANVAFLQGLPAADLNQLARAARRCTFARGETLMRQGDTEDSFFILISGQVSVLVNSGGADVKLNELRPPAFFGEMSLLTGEPRSATITALEPCECLVLAKDCLAKVLHANPDLAKGISAVLQNRLADRLQVVEASSRFAAHVDVERVDVLQAIRRFFAL